MPRVQKRPERPTFRRKCHSCGKMATNPLEYHIVPSLPYGSDMPVYKKSDVKTKRVDLKGDMKVAVYNFCDNQCYEEGKPKVQ